MCLPISVSSEHILVGLHMTEIDEIHLSIRRVIEDIRGSDVEDDPAVVLNFVVDILFEVAAVEPLITDFVSSRPRSTRYHQQIIDTFERKNAVNSFREVVLNLFDLVEFRTVRLVTCDLHCCSLNGSCRTE